ncbi:MAG: hypothetical protein ACK4K9_10185 [Bacteroidia bacterium]
MQNKSSIKKDVEKQLIRVDIPNDLLPVLNRIKSKGIEFNKLFIDYLKNPEKFKINSFSLHQKYIDEEKDKIVNAFSITLKGEELKHFYRLRLTHFQSVKRLSLFIIINIIQWLKEKKQIR